VSAADEASQAGFWVHYNIVILSYNKKYLVLFLYFTTVYCAYIQATFVVIYHFCCNGRFGDETDHLVLNELGGELVLEAVYEAQAKLNLISQNIFPLLPLQLNPSTVSVSADSF